MTDCCAVLLRGGKSRRMGQDKACLPWKDGLTFLQAVAVQMDFLPEKYLSVAAAVPRELSADWSVLPDRVPGCGPMGGIWTALTTCRADWALVASCDVPAVERTLFLRLLKERASGDYEIIYPATPDGRLHLTCALYEKRAAQILEQQIRRGDYRLRNLLSLCRCRTIPVNDPAEIRMLTNVNTKDSFRFLITS